MRILFLNLCILFSVSLFLLVARDTSLLNVFKSYSILSVYICILRLENEWCDCFGATGNRGALIFSFEEADYHLDGL